MARGRACAGFTLLELTIAMVFVALLAAGIVVTVSTSLTVWSKVLQGNEINQEGRAIMELVARDLRGAYLGRSRNTGWFSGGAPTDAAGNPVLLPGQTEATVDTLELMTESTSSANLALLPEEERSAWDQQVEPPVSDVMVVRWEAREADENGPAGLYRERWVASTPQAQVDGLTDTGADTGSGLGTVTDATQQLGLVSQELVSGAVESLHFQYYDGENWLGSWDSTQQQNALPQAVMIQLVLNDRDLAGVTSRSEAGARHAFETIVSIAAR